MGCISHVKHHASIEEIKLEILNKGDKNFEVIAEITNCSALKKSYYLPNKEDLCSSILVLFAIDDQGRKSRLFPCENVIDLEGFSITKSNSVFLNPSESMKFSFQFNVKEFEPILSGSNYRITLVYDSTKAISSEQDNSIFANILESNAIVF